MIPETQAQHKKSHYSIMEDITDITHAILAASEWAIRLRVPTFNNENVVPLHTT
jgi:hypothetical protein